MRQVFAGYYSPTKDEFDDLWKNALIVLDASTLLNLYRYSQTTRDQFLSLLSKYSEQLWIPHQVALEFQVNRLSVINEQYSTYEEILKILISTQSQIESALARDHPSIDRAEILKITRSSLDKIRDNLATQKEKHPDFLADDNVRTTLTTLLNGRVGSPFTQEQIDEHSKAASTRYAKEQPPGYKDASTKTGITKFGTLTIERKFGDLILWKQILAQASEKKTSVMFVTDDLKEDWWWIDRGRRIGPRPELVTEFAAITGSKFYMYTPEQFTKFASTHSKSTIPQDVIDEVKSVTESKKDQPTPRKIFRETIKSILLESNGLRTEDIYEEIKLRHPELCDDSIECNHGGVPTGQPEWKHQVRFALWDLKNLEELMREGGNWYLEEF